MIRFLAILPILAPVVVTLTGCGPSYSPDTYATNAAQQANKVEEGVIAGVRPVHISAQGTVGGLTGAAAGGIAGSQVGVGPTSAFAAIGGSLIGGIAGVATEHIIGDTDGFEYIVRKANGDMLSVAQKDQKPLNVGQKVLLIAGPQARIIPDYMVPFEAPAKTAAKPAPPTPPAADAHPGTAEGPITHPPVAEAPPPMPAETVVPPQLPAASGPPPASPPSSSLGAGGMAAEIPTASAPSTQPSPVSSTPKP